MKQEILNLLRQDLSRNNCSFEIFSEKDEIITIETHTKLHKREFIKTIHTFHYIDVIEIQKHHKKDLSGNNQYLIRLKIYNCQDKI